MNLREVLAEAVAADCGCHERKQHTDEARAALARLSQPDVLDELESRLVQSVMQEKGLHTTAQVRRVLADMFRGDS